MGAGEVLSICRMAGKKWKLCSESSYGRRHHKTHHFNWHVCCRSHRSRKLKTRKGSTYRVTLLKAGDETHYTAAASWNVIPSIDQMAPLPSSTVTLQSLSLWGVGVGAVWTYTLTHTPHMYLRGTFSCYYFYFVATSKMYHIPYIVQTSFKFNILGRKLVNQNFQDKLKEEMEPM